jgi:regulatory protein
MKIEKIKKQKNKYIIVLENKREIITYDEIIIEKKILYKKELMEEEIKEIEKENEYYEIYKEIEKNIKAKLRSENEIRTMMNKKNIKNELQEKIIKELKKTKLINDEIYVKAYIHDKIRFSNDGPLKIKKDLQKEQIEEKLIEEELEKIDRNQIKQKLEKNIIKKINSNTKYSYYILKQKILLYFMNLGYEKEEILEILENNKIDEKEIIKKEYYKLYNKLKNKYKEEELERQIKQRLYKKGFKIN